VPLVPLAVLGTHVRAFLQRALQEYAGIVTMCATTDHAQKSVLMLSNVRDRSIKLLELPAFSERGVLPDVSSRGCGCAALRQLPLDAMF
jgi:hypothetical protein